MKEKFTILKPLVRLHAIIAMAFALLFPALAVAKAAQAAAVIGMGIGATTGINSFPGDTLVLTPDGHRRIDELRPGDEVIAYAEWEEQSRPEKITDVILSHREQTLVTITLENGNVIEATGGHPIHTPTGWRAAQLLQAGGQLDVKDESGALVPMGIASVETRIETLPVYNLEVAYAHTFFVGEDGALAHNARRPHGNSASSTRPQHMYDIYDRSTGGVAKTGISGGPIQRCGKSQRAQNQVRRLNRQAGYDRYDSRVVAQGLPGSTRGDMLNAERARARQHRDNREPMNEHFFP